MKKQRANHCGWPFRDEWRVRGLYDVGPRPAMWAPRKSGLRTLAASPSPATIAPAIHTARRTAMTTPRHRFEA
ncbi:MAG: hypothetical protein AB7K09_18735, partial [Planctomycetota bacterium]